MNSTFNNGLGDGTTEFGSQNSSSVSRKFSSLAPFFKNGVFLGVPGRAPPTKYNYMTHSLNIFKDKTLFIVRKFKSLNMNWCVKSQKHKYIYIKKK